MMFLDMPLEILPSTERTFTASILPNPASGLFGQTAIILANVLIAPVDSIFPNAGDELVPGSSVAEYVDQFAMVVEVGGKFSTVSREWLQS